MRALSLISLFFALLALPAVAQTRDADEADLLNAYARVDVWHFPVDYSVGYSNQDVVVTRELVAQPAPAGKLCYIRFDLIQGEGDYAYGFKPPQLGAAPRPDVWGVYVHRRGTVLNQARSVLKMNVVYFYVEGPKASAAADICEKKQAAPTAQAGHAYNAPEWSDLIVRARLIHGAPPPPAQ